MFLTTDIPMSRIDARIPLSVRETIDRAAAMQGRTRTDFLIAAALEKAEQVIAERRLCALHWKISVVLNVYCLIQYFFLLFFPIFLFLLLIIGKKNLSEILATSPPYQVAAFLLKNY